MNKFRTSKRLGRLAFTSSCLSHIAVLTLLIFLTQKAFEWWPSMGPQADRQGVVQIELQTTAASSPEPVSIKPLEPAPATPEPEEPVLEEIQKEPEPKPEPEVLRTDEAKGVSTSTASQTAQIAQAASAPGAQINSNDPLAGSGLAAGTDWKALAIAQVRALVEREKYYPAAAQKAGYTGRFRVRIRLEPDGRISGCETIEHHGHPLLAKALETALAKIQGRSIGMRLPERFDILLPVEFELK